MSKPVHPGLLMAWDFELAMLVCSLCAACVHLLSGVSAEVPRQCLQGRGLDSIDWIVGGSPGKVVSLESLENNLEEKRSPLACSINCSLACPSQLQLKLKNTVQSKASKSEVLANFLRRGLRQIPLDGKAQIWHRNFGCFRNIGSGITLLVHTRAQLCPN